MSGDSLKREGLKLIRYFLSTLTIPEKELWVNLSPFEKDRITSASLGDTDMGRDLLAQDYLLKQLTASVLNPDHPLGRRFWDKVYAQTSVRPEWKDVAVDSFSKVWIVPERAVVHVVNNRVTLGENHLKVMLDQDYTAMRAGRISAEVQDTTDAAELARQTSAVMREVIVPELEREINSGATFANLRQMFHSMILATWYKRHLRESILGRSYVDREKLGGVESEDRDIKEKIYQRYLSSFKTGIGQTIREDVDPVTQELIPRKYFLGGLVMGVDQAMSEDQAEDNSQMIGRAVTLRTKMVAVPVLGGGEDRKFLFDRITQFEPADVAFDASQISSDMQRRINSKTEEIYSRHVIPKFMQPGQEQQRLFLAAGTRTVMDMVESISLRMGSLVDQLTTLAQDSYQAWNIPFALGEAWESEAQRMLEMARLTTINLAGYQERLAAAETIKAEIRAFITEVYSRFPQEVADDLIERALGMSLRFETGLNRFKLGATPYVNIDRQPAYDVRLYKANGEEKRRLFINYELINRSDIVDMMKGSSLIEYLTNNGISVYLVDWKGADKPYSMDDYLTMIGNAYSSSVTQAATDGFTGRLDVLGYCQGGTLLAMAIAKGLIPNPRSVSFLATPFDTREHLTQVDPLTGESLWGLVDNLNEEALKMLSVIGKSYGGIFPGEQFGLLLLGRREDVLRGMTVSRLRTVMDYLINEPEVTDFITEHIDQLKEDLGLLVTAAGGLVSGDDFIDHLSAGLLVKSFDPRQVLENLSPDFLASHLPDEVYPALSMTKDNFLAGLQLPATRSQTIEALVTGIFKSKEKANKKLAGSILSDLIQALGRDTDALDSFRRNIESNLLQGEDALDSFKASVQRVFMDEVTGFIRDTTLIRWVMDNPGLSVEALRQFVELVYLQHGMTDLDFQSALVRNLPADALVTSLSVDGDAVVPGIVKIEGAGGHVADKRSYASGGVWSRWLGVLGIDSAESSVALDKAQNRLGGIDLDAQGMDLQTRQAGAGVRFDKTAAGINIEGLRPVLIGVFETVGGMKQPDVNP